MISYKDETDSEFVQFNRLSRMTNQCRNEVKCYFEGLQEDNKYYIQQIEYLASHLNKEQSDITTESIFKEIATIIKNHFKDDQLIMNQTILDEILNLTTCHLFDDDEYIQIESSRLYVILSSRIDLNDSMMIEGIFVSLCSKLETKVSHISSQEKNIDMSIFISTFQILKEIFANFEIPSENIQTLFNITHNIISTKKQIIYNELVIRELFDYFGIILHKQIFILDEQKLFECFTLLIDNYFIDYTYECYECLALLLDQKSTTVHKLIDFGFIQNYLNPCFKHNFDGQTKIMIINFLTAIMKDKHTKKFFHNINWSLLPDFLLNSKPSVLVKFSNAITEIISLNYEFSQFFYEAGLINYLLGLSKFESYDITYNSMIAVTLSFNKLDITSRMNLISNQLINIASNLMQSYSISEIDYVLNLIISILNTIPSMVLSQKEDTINMIHESNLLQTLQEASFPIDSPLNLKIEYIMKKFGQILADISKDQEIHEQLNNDSIDGIELFFGKSEIFDDLIDISDEINTELAPDSMA